MVAAYHSDTPAPTTHGKNNLPLRHCGLRAAIPLTKRGDHYLNSYIYFMANAHNTTLYIGVTSDLVKRVWEHKNDFVKSSFTSRYNCHKLVYYEVHSDIKSAITREKQLKNWKREWKNELVSKENPEWNELSIT